LTEANRVELTGRIAALGALRYTPAGVPVIQFGIRHESEIPEAGTKRKVSAEIEAIAFQAQARMVAGTALSRPLRVSGFLAAKSRRSKKLVLHVTDIEFVEGD
jgi:primosomal replication protein N